MTIGKFCNPHVLSVPRDTTVLEAAHLMRHNHVGDVVVADTVDGGRVPVGLVTDRDIVVEVVSPGLDPRVIQVGDLLQRPIVTVRDRAGYAETIHVMAEHGVRRVPIVNDAGLLIGIITLDDLLYQLAKPLGDLSVITQRGRVGEALTRR